MAQHVQQNISLKHYTTLKIGGVADYVWEVERVEELEAACRFAKQTDTPLLVLGGGSNILIADEGFRGLVVINKLKKREYSIEGEKVTVRLGAGEVLDEVVAWTCANGWWGLENLSAIPGTVGATPVQNVGAYGVEVAALITEVRAFNKETASEKIFSNGDCCFSYRDSFFKTNEGKRWIITELVYELSTAPNPTLTYADIAALQSYDTEMTPTTVRNEIIHIRSAKFPDWSIVGTAGSFFKNPVIPEAHYRELIGTYPDIPGYSHGTGMVKVSLGFILDKVCGLKGYKEGRVGLFERQALVLVTEEGATAEDVKKFVEKISQIVFAKTKIQIECEVLFV